VVDILDVDTIVLGGGLTKNEYYTNMVVEFIVKNYYRLPAKTVNVERTIYQLNSGVMGMIFLIRDLFGGVDAC
ncbi:MAG: ROK family protein, partial [Pseudothermotoga sp.]